MSFIDTNSGSKKIIIPVVVAALIVITVIGVYAYQQNMAPVVNTSTQNVEVTENTAPAATSPYKDGTYSATGSYVSPGGPRDIDVTVTIQNGAVTDSTFTGKATDPASKRFQGEFADNYKSFVVGKNIDEVVLTKVSGSSLTPKGFEDALNKIKQQAQS